jgi:hypothetical protein
MGSADEEVEVALWRVVLFIEDDPCPPTRNVKDADVLDTTLPPELEFEAAIELNNPPMVALVAIEADDKLLVES